MTETSTDREADIFERTEQRLNEWGYACRENSKSLGLPTISGIARMIDHVRRQDRLEKTARKKALRKSRKAWKAGDPATDSKLVAEELGYADKELTARGTQKKSSIGVVSGLDSRTLKVDATISRLPKWMQATIKRSYQFNQPDRRAAQDLRIPKSVYRLRRIAAVQLLAELLRA